MKFTVTVLVLVLLISSCYGPESRKRAAQLEYEKGTRLYNKCEFRGAKKAFEHALWLNPNHEAAKIAQAQVRKILGDWGVHPWEVEELEKTYGKDKRGR